jgi:biotin carboxylase
MSQHNGYRENHKEQRMFSASSGVQRLLLLSATDGYQSRAFQDAARSLGLQTVLATNRCQRMDDPWGDQALPVRFEEPQASAAALCRKLEHCPVHGIVSVGDRPSLVAALTAEKLGLPFHSPGGVSACRSKFLFRELIEDAGMPVPAYFTVAVGDGPQEASLRAPFPCVLKPLGLSASRGVIRADDPRQFVSAFQRIAALLASPEVRQARESQTEFIQVESFIPGREYALEGLISAGELQVLAVFEKPDPLEGPFFEETLYITPPRIPHEELAAIVTATQRAVEAIGLTHGPLHAEMRVNPEGVYMIEMAARPIGGLCARSLRFSNGDGLEHLVIRHAMGEDVRTLAREDQASGVMMIPIPHAGVYQGVSGVEQARATPGVEDVVITAKEGYRLLPLPEGASYLGFLFARAPSASEVEAALRTAHQRLHFDILSALPVIGRTAAYFD